MRLAFAIALPGIALALSGAAQAQQQTKSATFRVSTSVQAACAVAASDLDFGQDTSRSGSNLTGGTNVAVRCAPETAYNIALNAGAAPGASANRRQMLAGTNQLNYQLYQDSGRSKIWGNTIGTDTVPGAGTGQSVDHTIFGAVPARQVIRAGEYGDTVTVQVYF
jgi:spore coat protein U-like protein